MITNVVKKERKMFLLLLALGNIGSTEAHTGLDLSCTHDLKSTMVCQFNAQNCNEYNLTVHTSLMDIHDPVNHCSPSLCSPGNCCCKMTVSPVFVQNQVASVLKESQIVQSFNFTYEEIIKPVVPTIVSVEKVNGDIWIYWKSNYEEPMVFSQYLNTTVTYHEKGDKKMVSIKPSGKNIHVISSKSLKPSTTYLVSLKSYMELSQKFSDSSKEHEFTTSISEDTMTVAITVTLSIVMIIISSVIFACIVKLKSTFWDTFTQSQKPGFIDIVPSKPEILKPLPISISSVCVEPLLPEDNKPWSGCSPSLSSTESFLESSGISMGSSSLSYANTEPPTIIESVQAALSKALVNFQPNSPMTTNPLTESNNLVNLFPSSYNPCDAEQASSGSTGSGNKDNSPAISTLPNHVLIDNLKKQTPDIMLCDSSYLPSETDASACLDKCASAFPVLKPQDIVFPPVGSFHTEIDMSYQQNNVDSTRSEFTEVSSLSPVPSDTAAPCDPDSEVEFSSEKVPYDPSKMVFICHDNPCYALIPASGHSLQEMDDAYQSLPSVVEQHNV